MPTEKSVLKIVGEEQKYVGSVGFQVRALCVRPINVEPS